MLEVFTKCCCEYCHLTVTVIETITTLVFVIFMNAVIAVITVMFVNFHLTVIDITTVTIMTTQKGVEVHLQAAAEGGLSAGGLPQDQSASQLSLLLLLLFSSKLK